MSATRVATVLTSLPFIVAVVMTGDARADSASSNINISTTVVENCMVSATALNFGAYDPIIANAADPLFGTGAVNVSCTDGTEANVMLTQGEYGKSDHSDGSAGRMSNNVGESVGSEISYELFSDPGRSVTWGGTEETSVRYTGTGQNSELTVYGSIAPGQNLPEGNYSAVVLATVIF